MAEYLYHITKKRIAFDHIKTQGLIPAAKLSGASIARSEGAFASEREKNMQIKIRSKLTSPLSYAIARGYTAEQIKNKIYRPFPLSLDINTNRDDAYEKLSDVEKKFYRENFPQITGKYPPGGYLKERENIKKLADDMLRDMPGHVLCRFAKEISHLEYAIEERVTSEHIYFFTGKDMKPCYQSYTGHHGGEIKSSVLRVKRDAVNHLVKDQAEQYGFMTTESVLPESIEIYNAEGSPLDSEGDDNWCPLSQL
ncbi:hypothetical protein ABW286_22835 [Erwinia papayae]|uniref:Uncharacterized protein n=1 Tax=Erwinia papayae TaxID=206499 RepID=A0ABV3N8B5_9GAMM